MQKRKRQAVPGIFAAIAAAGIMLAACGNGEPPAAPAASTPSPAPASADTETGPGTPGTAETPVRPGAGLPVGPAVMVEEGYHPPEDRVPSTGAHLPANGKPTLVYVDAIW